MSRKKKFKTSKEFFIWWIMLSCNLVINLVKFNQFMMNWTKNSFSLDYFTTSLVLTNQWFNITATLHLKCLYRENQFASDSKSLWLPLIMVIRTKWKFMQVSSLMNQTLCTRVVNNLPTVVLNPLQVEIFFDNFLTTYDMMRWRIWSFAERLQSLC